MASITCTKCGATLKTAKPVEPGKKMKCPKCAKVFVVEDEEAPEEEDRAPEEEADEEDAPKPKKKPVKTARRNDDDDEDDDDAPAKKGKSSRPEPKKGGAGLLLGIVGGVLLLCCIGCGAVGFVFQAGLKKLAGFGDELAKKLDEENKKKIDAEKGDDKPPPAFGKADFNVKAADIAGHFSDKHREAFDKYNGKSVEITGKVITVSYLESDKRLCLHLQGDGNNKIIAPIQDADHAKLIRLANGQEVKIAGHFRKHEASAVLFGTSGFEEVEKSKIIEIASTALAADYGRNAAKYGDKAVLVTGEVIDIKGAGTDSMAATLKSAPNAPVRAEFSPLSKHAAAKLEVGKVVSLRCELIVGGDGDGVNLMGVVVGEIKDKDKVVEKVDKKIDKKVPVDGNPIEISDDALAREFAADHAGALDRYKGRMLRVDGEVESVGPVKTIVYLKGAKKSLKDKSEYHLALNVKLNQVATSVRFSKGQKIQAVGKLVTADAGTRTVTLADCTVTETEPSTILVFKAEDLAREFETDLKAAQAKYRLKDMIVTGVVDEVRDGPTGGKTVVYKGTNKLRVTALANPQEPIIPAIGQIVEFRAATGTANVQGNELRITSRIIITLTSLPKKQ